MLLPVWNRRRDQPGVRADLSGAGDVAAGRTGRQLHLLVRRPDLDHRAADMSPELRRHDGLGVSVSEQCESGLLLPEWSQLGHHPAVRADLRQSTCGADVSCRVNGAMPRRQRQPRNPAVCAADLRLTAGELELPDQPSGQLHERNGTGESDVCANVRIPAVGHELSCGIHPVLHPGERKCRDTHLPAGDLWNAAADVVLPDRRCCDLSERIERGEQPELRAVVRDATRHDDLSGGTGRNLHGGSDVRNSPHVPPTDLRCVAGRMVLHRPCNRTVPVRHDGPEQSGVFPADVRVVPDDLLPGG